MITKLYIFNHVKYALIMCGLIILCLVYMELSGNNQSFEHNVIVQSIYALAPVAVWFLGIRSFKKLLGGKMGWKEGVVEGFRISLVYAIVLRFSLTCARYIALP